VLTARWIAWDGENRPVEITTEHPTGVQVPASFGYGPDGGRVRMREWGEATRTCRSCPLPTETLTLTLTLTLEHRPGYRIQDDALGFLFFASSFSVSRKPPFGMML